MSTAPQTLPANFTGWDQPASAAKPPATLPANFSQWDDQKPAQQQQSAAPPQKDFQSRVADRIMGNFDNTGHAIMAIPDAIDQVMSQAKAGTNLPTSAADVPAYVGRAMAKGATAVGSMVQKLINDYRNDPATLVGDIVTAKAFKGVGEEPGVGASAGTTAADTAKSAATSDVATHAVGVLSPRIARMMKSVQAGDWQGLVPDRMVHAIEGAKAAADVFRGGASKAAPDAASAEMPNTFGTPRSQWGGTVDAPGAPFPAKPAPELLQGNALAKGGQPAPPNPSDALRSITVRPQPAPTPTPEGVAPSGQANTLPETLNGESALRQVLTGQDNANLLKIAKSRGINVTKESALKPGTANTLLVDKIVNDFSPDELDEIRAQYVENNRFRHAFGNVGPEAWKTMSLQTYFPELKIPQAVINRTSNSIRLSSLVGK